MGIWMEEKEEGRLVRLCIEAAAESKESVEKWRRQHRTLERMPTQLGDALLHRLLRRRLLFPSLLEIFQHCVEEINLKGENLVDAEWMAYVGAFRHLRVLNMADCRGIANSALWSITGMTSLMELDLSRCSKVTDAGIEHLLSIPNLKKLCISETGVTANAVMRLSSLKKLSFLDLGGLPVTDQALHSLQVMTELEYLDLWGSQISNMGVSILKMFPKLSFLSLAWTNVTNLPKLPSVTCLNMSRCTIQSLFEGDDEVKTSLSKLLIAGATFVDLHQDFSYLEASKLSVLDISSSTIQDFHFLENMNRLEYLDLSFSRIDDDHINSVECIGWNLRDLNLSNTRVSTAGIAALAGKVPNLESLSLSHTAVDDDALPFISMMPSLVVINLSNTNIKGFTYKGGDHQDRFLSLMPLQNLNHLKSLDLEDTQVRDEMLLPLCALQELNRLSLKSDFLSDVSLHALSSLPKLEGLGIRGAVLTNNGLHSFKPPPMLLMLDLRECWLLTRDAVVAFCRCHPQIEVRHELVQTPTIHPRVGDDSSASHGMARTSQSKLKKGKSSQVPFRFQKEKFMDERIKYSREELLQLQYSVVRLSDTGITQLKHKTERVYIK